MKPIKLCFLGLWAATAWCGRAQTYVDLAPLFNTDAVLELGGAGLGNPLDTEGRRIDAGTLPAAYTDGAPVTTADGRATFRFGVLRQSSLDAVAVDGQVLDIVDAQYTSLDLALLSAPGALASPFGEVGLEYADGTTEQRRLGPVPGWLGSPTAFDHTLYRFTDDSEVQTLASFRTDFGDAEAAYLAEERGNGNSGGNRFVDGTGYVLYRFGDLGDLREAKLGVTVGNNFVISISSALHEPSTSTEGYTEVLNSMVLYDGFEHRALGNLKQYDVDLAPFLAEGTGEIYLLLTDATPGNGWGPYLQRVLFYTGTSKNFEAALDPAIEAGSATVHAAFRTGTSEETPFLYDNRGSGPSNRGHRFADGAGTITYRFDLPDEVTNATLTVDMANNFVVSLAGASDTVRYASVAAATAEEKAYLVDEGGSITGGDYRFADASAYMVYQFDLPDDVTTAFARIQVGNQFVIEAADATGDFTVEKDWVAETGEETRDNSNLDFYTVDLTPYLANNPSRIVRLRLSDGIPSDGWGPFLRSIIIQNRAESGDAPFEEVLNSEALYGEDVHTEWNKKYYTVDLAGVLASNPQKVFFVQFTDGSTSDGWGPGIFWMAVHTGPLSLASDRLVFDQLKTTLGDPQPYGAALLHRRYPVDGSKTLARIHLPAQPATESSQVHLLAATLSSQVASSPTLQVAATSDGRVRLSWPASAAGYQLKAATSLASPITWVAVSEEPTSEGGSLGVTVTPSNPGAYYRLESTGP
ncbi:MAG: hypothetical protein KIT22_13745 [Verrucomicrobiae bacterium]|nr:hypothetical protein [Verrucomicrobiae bacterium]